MNKIPVFLFLIIILVANATAYNANIDIFVTDSGIVTITGNTDDPNLLIKDTSEYTSKKAEYWLLNISKEIIFSEVNYTLHLPKDSSINYIKTPELSRIENSAQELRIIGSASNKQLNLLVQYKINKSVVDRSNIFIYILIVIILTVLISILFFTKKKKTRKIDLSSLTQRQAQIMKLIISNKNKITQAKLEKLTGLPKSSLSRNVDSLVKKGLIEKETKGMTNLLKISEKQ